MMFARNVFGHRKFNINDDRLFRSGRNVAGWVQLNTPPPANLPLNKMAPPDDCMCVTVLVFIFCPYPETAECAGECDRCFLCMSSVTTDVCFTDGGVGGGTGWIPPPTGGGGAGTGPGAGPTAGSPPPCPVALGRCTAGWNPKPPEDPTNPCIGAKGHAKKASVFAATTTFQKAAGQIQSAINGNPNQEYVVAFGRDASGNPIHSPVQPGGSNSANVPDISGAFADLHNHPGNTEPSAGDLYGMISMNTPTNGFDIRYVMTGGTIYAFVIFDPVKADKFVVDNPLVQTVNPQTGQPYPPNFSPAVFGDYDNSQAYFEGVLNYPQPLADAMAMAFTLEKHNVGVAILKLEPKGNFKILRAKQSNPGAPYPEFEDISCN